MWKIWNSLVLVKVFAPLGDGTGFIYIVKKNVHFQIIDYTCSLVKVIKKKPGEVLVWFGLNSTIINFVYV